MNDDVDDVWLGPTDWGSRHSPAATLGQAPFQSRSTLNAWGPPLPPLLDQRFDNPVNIYRTHRGSATHIDMARRNPGFVSKKPHRKSRGGCMTCKKKKVKVSRMLRYDLVSCSCSAMKPSQRVDIVL